MILQNESSKTLTNQDDEQALRYSFNPNTKTMATSGFLDSKVGHKIHIRALSATVDEVNSFDVVLTEPGTTTITLSTITGLTFAKDKFVVGQYLFGTGIPENTKIVSVDSESQITISNAATASGTVSIKYANLLTTLILEYNNAAHDVFIDGERTY